MRVGMAERQPDTSNHRIVSTTQKDLPGSICPGHSRRADHPSLFFRNQGSFVNPAAEPGSPGNTTRISPGLLLLTFSLVNLLPRHHGQEDLGSSLAQILRFAICNCSHAPAVLMGCRKYGPNQLFHNSIRTIPPAFQRPRFQSCDCPRCSHVLQAGIGIRSWANGSGPERIDSRDYALGEFRSLFRRPYHVSGGCPSVAALNRMCLTAAPLPITEQLQLRNSISMFREHQPEGLQKPAKAR